MSRVLIAVAVGLLSVGTALAGTDVAELLKELKSGDQEVRLQAIDSLGEQGEASPEVLQALIKQLKDDSPMIRAHAAHALGHFGPSARPAIDALAPLIIDPDLRVRRMALRTWAHIRPGPKVSIPLLAKVLENADPAARTHALALLAEFGKPVVPVLVEALENKKLTYWSCLVLAEIGPDAAEAAPALAELIQTAVKSEIRREAALALAAIGPAAATAVPTLIKALDDKTASVSCGAAFALGSIGPKAKSAEQELTKCGESTNPLLKIIAAWALAKIEPQDDARKEKAVSLLSAALGDKNPRVRRLAMRGLVDLQPSPDSILAAIKNANISAKDDIVEELLVVASGLGKPAVPLLIESLRIERVGPLAASLLGRMGPTAKEAVPALADIAARNKNIAARCEALLALGAIGHDSPEAIQAAASALKDPEEDVRYAACYALGKIGKPAAVAVPELKKMLVGKDEFMAMESAWALANIEPASAEIAKVSVPLLIRSLKSPEPGVRIEAAKALGCLGSLAKDAVPALKKLARGKDERIRDTANEALKSIGQ